MADSQNPTGELSSELRLLMAELSSLSIALDAHAERLSPLLLIPVETSVPPLSLSSPTTKTPQTVVGQTLRQQSEMVSSLTKRVVSLTERLEI